MAAQNTRPQWTETTSGFGLFSFLCWTDAVLSGSRLLVEVDRTHQAQVRTRQAQAARMARRADSTARHGMAFAPRVAAGKSALQGSRPRQGQREDDALFLYYPSQRGNGIDLFPAKRGNSLFFMCLLSKSGTPFEPRFPKISSGKGWSEFSSAQTRQILTQAKTSHPTCIDLVSYKPDKTTLNLPITTKACVLQ
jgi:hypothetical protein